MKKQKRVDTFAPSEHFLSFKAKLRAEEDAENSALLASSSPNPPTDEATVTSVGPVSAPPASSLNSIDVTGEVAPESDRLPSPDSIPIADKSTGTGPSLAMPPELTLPDKKSSSMVSTGSTNASTPILGSVVRSPALSGTNTSSPAPPPDGNPSLERFSEFLLSLPVSKAEKGMFRPGEVHVRLSPDVISITKLLLLYVTNMPPGKSAREAEFRIEDLTDYLFRQFLREHINEIKEIQKAQKYVTRSHG